jgi:hypothetical protein
MFVNVQNKQNVDTSSNRPQIRVTAMPGQHVPTKPLQKLNELLQAVCFLISLPLKDAVYLNQKKLILFVKQDPTHKRLDGRTGPS